MQSPYASRKHRQLYDEPFTPYTASVRTPRTGRYIPGSAFNSPSYYQSPVSAVPRFAVQQGRPFQRNLQRMSRFFRPQHSPQLPPQQQMFSPLPPLQYAVVMAEPEAVTPFSAATKRAVFYKATSVLCLVLTGFMAMYGYILNELVVLNIPAYTQGTSSHSAQTINVRAYGEVNALANSTWAAWSRGGFNQAIVVYGPLIAGAVSLVAALFQSYGMAIRRELPIALQALMAGLADRRFPDEKFQRYAFMNIKLWWILLFAWVPLAVFVFHLVVFLSTQSAMRAVPALGPQTTVSMGLTLMCSILALVMAIHACILGGLEQQQKALLKDIEDRMLIAQAIDMAPPEYESPSAYGGDYLPEKRIDSRHATRADSFFKRSRNSPTAEVHDWDQESEDDLDGKSTVIPQRKPSTRKPKYREWDDVSISRSKVSKVSEKTGSKSGYEWGAPMQ